MFVGSAKKHGSQSLGFRCGGFSTKIHLATDALGNAIRFILTGGQRNDITQAEALTENLTAEYVLADKGYDSEAFVVKLKQSGAEVVIPSRINRKVQREIDAHLVRDGWLSYNWYGQCRHSLCNAHLLRDLTYIGEAEPPHKWWTTALAKLLIEIKEAVKAARNSLQPELDSDRGKDFLNRYDALLAQAEEAVRGSPEQKSTGLTAGKLLNRFIKNKAEVLRFMTDLKVPFDNNGSERDLRMLKLQQKIAGCFRTTEGVTAFCRVRSYLSSARKQGRSLLIAIESALKGKPIALIS